MSSSRSTSRVGRAAVFALAGALALGACSNASTGSSSVAGAAQGAVGPVPAVGTADKAMSGDAVVAAPDAAAARAAGAAEGSGATSTTIEQPKVVTTVGMFLTVDDVRLAATAIRGVAAGIGGVVLNEAVNATDAAPTTPQPATSKGTTASTAVRQGNYGQIVLGIPADKLAAALEQLSRLGVEVQRTSTSDDVTTTYVDLQARIDNMKASVAQVRAYLAQAKDLVQMVTIEAEVTRRQSDLDSLQGQLNALSTQVARSTVTVTFTSKPQTVAADDTNAFLAGLRSGWSAFVASGSAALTVIGVLLPWLIAAAVIGLPLSAWLRRRRAARPQPAAPVYAPAPGMPPAPVLVTAGAPGAPVSEPTAGAAPAGPGGSGSPTTES